MVIACEHFGVEGGARVRCNCLNQWAQTIVFISKVCSVYKNIGIGCRWTTVFGCLFYFAIKNKQTAVITQLKPEAGIARGIFYIYVYISYYIRGLYYSFRLVNANKTWGKEKNTFVQSVFMMSNHLFLTIQVR